MYWHKKNDLETRKSHPAWAVACPGSQQMEMRIKGELLQQMDADLRMWPACRSGFGPTKPAPRALEDRKAYLEAQRDYGEYYMAPGKK